MSGILKPVIWALIPARGGSKGLPRKNVKMLAGKPLIAWTVEAARASEYLAKVIVSSDDAEIIEIACRYGAMAPFRRPDELASDTTSSVDVALHALEWFARCQQEKPEFLMLLQPTSPLRTTEDIDAICSLQEEKNADAIVSVCPGAHPPHWLRSLKPGNVLQAWNIDADVARRQDCPAAYQINGALYLVRTEMLAAERTFMPPGTLGYIMPPERSIDIDTPWDFHLTDLILKDRQSAATNGSH